MVRQVRELSLLGLIGARPGDAARVRAEVPCDYLRHLDAAGLAVPRVVAYPDTDPHTELRPFGWSAESIELNRSHDRPVAHPALESVRLVNSRSFARELQRELGEPFGRMVGDVTALEKAIAAGPAGATWVVKAEHGNSGLANRRIGRSLSAADRRFVDALFVEDDSLLLEPWLDRDRDWAVVFEAPFDPAGLRIHECVTTRDGAMIGALFEPRGPADCRWTGELAAAAETVARRLGAAGYFGPVCMDAFSWRGRGGFELRALSDLNCRRSMSDGAWRAWRFVAAERVAYFRFFSRRKLRLPGTLAETAAALGPRAWDRSRRSGILPLSPLSSGKFAVFFVADDRAGVAALEAWFRERFEA